MTEAPAPKAVSKIDERRKLELQNTLNRISVIAGIFDTRMGTVNCKPFHTIREMMDIYIAAAIRALSEGRDYIDTGVVLKDEERASLETLILKIFGDPGAKKDTPAQKS
ncbi:MAG: hypothetical protein ACKOEE_07150 [Tagaea sp.]|nr:hypothetical protein [Azospirillum sp.]MCA3266040.1 hypothetical protein [Azospirillum sp.]MCZ8125097.1 hypothetical protein [Magnetospirillum sp.]